MRKIRLMPTTKGASSMAIDDLDPGKLRFRAAMRDLALKGALATKRRAKLEPDLFPALGRRGGIMSGIARRAKCAREAAQAENATAKDAALAAATPPPPPALESALDREARRKLDFERTLADLEGKRSW
jgi:hypothetical protein